MMFQARLIHCQLGSLIKNEQNWEWLVGRPTAVLGLKDAEPLQDTILSTSVRAGWVYEVLVIVTLGKAVLGLTQKWWQLSYLFMFFEELFQGLPRCWAVLWRGREAIQTLPQAWRNQQPTMWKKLALKESTEKLSVLSLQKASHGPVVAQTAAGSLLGNITLSNSWRNAWCQLKPVGQFKHRPGDYLR